MSYTFGYINDREGGIILSSRIFPTIEAAADAMKDWAVVNMVNGVSLPVILLEAQALN